MSEYLFKFTRKEAENLILVLRFSGGELSLAMADKIAQTIQPAKTEQQLDAAVTLLKQVVKSSAVNDHPGLKWLARAARTTLAINEPDPEPAAKVPEDKPAKKNPEVEASDAFFEGIRDGLSKLGLEVVNIHRVETLRSGLPHYLMTDEQARQCIAHFMTCECPSCCEMRQKGTVPKTESEMRYWWRDNMEAR